MGKWDKYFKKLPEDGPRSLGELLKIMRKETGRTQIEHAKRVKLARETVSAIETDKDGTIDKISMETLEQWHNACRPSMSNKVIGFYTSVMKKIHRIP